MSSLRRRAKSLQGSFWSSLVPTLAGWLFLGKAQAAVFNNGEDV